MFDLKDQLLSPAERLQRRLQYMTAFNGLSGPVNSPQSADNNTVPWHMDKDESLIPTRSRSLGKVKEEPLPKVLDDFIKDTVPAGRIHDTPTASRSKSWKQRNLEGWRAGATASCAMALAVFIINFSITCWVVSNHPLVGRVGTLYSGSCAKARSTNTWLQLIINILSSTLLGASNYCMQCLSSPTREEIDKAHARGQWLDVGIPSLRNIKGIKWRRKLLWFFLVLSALPLHFVYNSVVFLTTQANVYTVLPVSEQFLHTGVYDTSLRNTTLLLEYNYFLSQNYAHNDSKSYPYLADLDFQSIFLAVNLTWTRAIEVATDFSTYINEFHPMNTSDCFNAYSSQYTSSWGDVMLVHTSTVGLTKMYGGDRDLVGADILPLDNRIAINDGIWLYNLNRTIYFKDLPHSSDPRIYPSNMWQCNPAFNATCGIEQKFRGQESWRPFGQPVQYCLAKKTEEQCRLLFNLDFAVIVMVCNLAKVVCMFLTLWMHDEAAFMTIGDAISSFLENPDPHTRGFCIFESRLIKLLWSWDEGKDSMPFSGFIPGIRFRKMDFIEDPRSRQWRPKVRRWYASAATSRWILCCLLYVSSFTATFTLFFISTKGKALSLGAMSKFGFGNAVGNNILAIKFSLPIAVVHANLPQTLISYIYVFFNWLYTCMYSGYEWAKYAEHRRTLRVTSLVGKQRGTYYLQLPYRYSIPLLVLLGILAWLASQSFFVVQIRILEHGSQTIDLISSCGYSPGAVVLAIIVGTLIFLGAVIMGLREYPTGIPLAATCSAGISAACHAPADDVDASVLPVQWGVVSVKDGIGHCAFSSKVVAPPIPGHVYAGTLEDIKILINEE